MALRERKSSRRGSPPRTRAGPSTARARTPSGARSTRARTRTRRANAARPAPRREPRRPVRACKRRARARTNVVPRPRIAWRTPAAAGVASSAVNRRASPAGRTATVATATRSATRPSSAAGEQAASRARELPDLPPHGCWRRHRPSPVGRSRQTSQLSRPLLTTIQPIRRTARLLRGALSPRQVSNHTNPSPTQECLQHAAPRRTTPRRFRHRIKLPCVHLGPP